MEPQHQPRAIAIPAAASAPSDDDRDEDHHPDSSTPVGSPEDTESCVPQPSAGNQASVPPEVLRLKIIKQVEYYLGDENLPNDKFLMKYVSKNAEGYVPIGVIGSFRKMKKLTRDTSLIVDALKESSLLVVSSNGKKVKRLNPLPVAELIDPMVCTVLVENLPEDHSIENLRRVFTEAGNVKHITIREPHDVGEAKECTVAEKIISGRLHALVEYDTIEAAEKAVATLNNEQDWRYGLRVKLLKKSNKPGQKKQVWRNAQAHHEKSTKAQTTEQSGNDVENNHHPSEQHDDSHGEEDVDHPLKAKSGASVAKEKNGPKGRNRGRGTRQKHYGTNGLGHGAQSSNHGPEPSKPPPGPRMPDGTRGFTLGRGRPLAPSST